MIKLFQIVAISMTIFSTFISISSSSWLGAWVGLEVNLLSIMPLMIFNKNFQSSESSIKYFITQIVASIMLLTFILMMMMNFPNSFYGIPLPYMGILMSLMLKMGAAPLHFWLPSVMEGLPWLTCAIIMTWQKITPLILLSFLTKINMILFLFIFFSAMIGAIGGFNQTNLKKIMAFSSINHIAWMITAISMNEMSWIMYFIPYCLISISAAFFFLSYNFLHLNQMWNFLNKKFLSKITVSCMFLSLGGLPPFLGFFPKWIIISKLINMQFFIIMTLILSSLITLFFYIRIIFSMISLSSSTSLTMKIHKSMYFVETFTLFISLLGLFIIPVFLV